MTSRTVPAPQDSDFWKLADRVDALMKIQGFGRRDRVGSVSWAVYPGTRNASVEQWKPLVGAALWKLCYYAQDKVVFGVRRELVDSVKKLARLEWPLEFSVPPASEVIFRGFYATNDRDCLEAIERLLADVGEAYATAPAADDQAHRAFFRSLRDSSE